MNNKKFPKNNVINKSKLKSFLISLKYRFKKRNPVKNFPQNNVIGINNVLREYKIYTKDSKILYFLKIEVYYTILNECSQYFDIYNKKDKIILLTKDNKFEGSFVIKLEINKFESYLNIIIESWIDEKLFNKEYEHLISLIKYSFISFED